MFRPFLLICALFACLGVSSACLTTKEWMSIFPEDSKKQKELWEKAKVRADVWEVLDSLPLWTTGVASCST